MNIGFLFYLKTTRNDLTKPELGNPGIGGTQFQMILLAHFLSKEKADWRIYCLTYNDMLLSENLNFVKIGENNLLETINNLQIDILVIAYSEFSKLQRLDLPKNLKIITRSGNDPDFVNLRWIVKNENVKANIFVGKQQYDCHIDCDIIKKSKTIFNIIYDNVPDYVRNPDEQIVVYMGSLKKPKGFHILARMWKSILKEVPKAKLYVLGSGKLYDSNAKLGKFNIAEERYENEFMPYLLDKNRELLSSVTFFGIVGKEKYDIFSRCAVGVANPSGCGETFCSTVLEMNCAKLPVVSINKFSLPDVVKNGETGLLGNNKKQIKKCIIRLLKNRELNLTLGENAKQYVKNFSCQKIIPQWIEFFEQVQSGTFAPKYEPPVPPFLNRHKWLCIMNRFLKLKIGLKFLPGLREMITFAKSVGKFILRKGELK